MNLKRLNPEPGIKSPHSCEVNCMGEGGYATSIVTMPDLCPTHLDHMPPSAPSPLETPLHPLPSESAFYPPAPFSVLFTSGLFQALCRQLHYSACKIASPTSYPLDSLAPLLSTFQHPQHLQFFLHLSPTFPGLGKGPTDVQVTYLITLTRKNSR